MDDVYSFDMSFNDFKAQYRPSDITLFDRNHLALETLRVNPNERSLSWTTIKETSHAFSKFLILSEDKKFYEHNGVDFKAIIKAAWDRLSDSSSIRGASTITMQLINVLHPELKGIKKGFSEKFEQIKLALELEKKWSKDQILEAYINIVPFRGEILGLKAASYGFFNKSPSALNDQEAALLVAMIRSPNAKMETVALRACMLLEDHQCREVLSKTRKVFSKSYTIEREKSSVAIIDKSFVKVKLQKNDFNIYTTLSRDIQKVALDALHEQIKNLKDQNLSDGAILVLNNHTGEVLAYVPNGGERFSKSPRFDNIKARRQAGSTLKPFIYAKAIDDNLLTQTSLVDDSPVDIPIGKGAIYFPRNYDNSFHGLVSAEVALGSSLNVPAVKTLMLLGEGKVLELLKKLGFKKLEDAGYYGPSLALGSVDVSLWDLTHAYKKLNESALFKKETIEVMTNILSNAENRRLTFGTDSVLTFPFKVAVKTGTSKDMRDNWCVGYTKNYTVGVWVGNSSGQAMWNVSGITGAAPIFRTVMMMLEKGTMKSHQMQFAKSEQKERIDQGHITQIRYPVEGEIIGYDLEIPKNLQRLPIEIVNLKSFHKIAINDLELKPLNNEIFFWTIEKGKHVLTLKDKNNNDEVLETVHFEVR